MVSAISLRHLSRALLPVLVAAAVLATMAVVDARAAPVPPRLSLAVPHELAAGATGRGTGRVTPPQGGRVVLEARRHAAWRSLGDGTLGAGRFRILFVVPKSAASELRLRATLVRRGRSIARSPVRTVRIERAPGAGPERERSGAPPVAPPPASGGPSSGGEASPPPAVGLPGEEVLPPGDVYWGAWIGSQLTGNAAPWDMNAVSEFEQHTGKPLSMIEFSSPFADCSRSPCTDYDFPSGAFDLIRAHGAIPFFSWGSESTPGGATQPDFQLADIIAGTDDEYIRDFATRAREWGHPFFLRFDWEMNGDWFPWGEGTNGNNPGEFASAWRHVHDIFASVGATNATWVWCPYVNRINTYASLYPGDAYVDWTCLDGYNWGTNPAAPYGWRTFDSLYGAAYAKVVESVAPSKPMVIGEVASSEYGGSKAAWIEEMFAALPTRYPQVRGLLWFETISNGMDWPLESSDSALDAFATGIAGSRYRGNESGGIETNPIPPP